MRTFLWLAQTVHITDERHTAACRASHFRSHADNRQGNSR